MKPKQTAACAPQLLQYADKEDSKDRQPSLASQEITKPNTSADH